MLDGKFNKEDREKFIKFLNFIAKNAKFDGMKVDDSIQLVNLLSHMQTQIIPKIESNTLEVVEVTEPKEESGE